MPSTPKTTTPKNPKTTTPKTKKAVIDKAEYHGGSFEIEGGNQKWTVTVTLEDTANEF